MKLIELRRKTDTYILMNFNNIESITKSDKAIYFNAIANNTDEVSYQANFSTRERCLCTYEKMLNDLYQSDFIIVKEI